MKFIISKQQSRLLKEEDESEYYKISPEEYLDMLKLSGNHAVGISRLRKFGGKPLWITGSLDVSRKDINDLGNIGYVEGNLDISNTKISDISQIKVKGRVSDWSTPIEARRKAAELREKRLLASERREENEWDPQNTDDEGLKANALFEWLVGQGELETPDEESNEKLKSLKAKLEELNQRYNSDELESSEVSDLHDEITDLETEIEEMESEFVDVYELVPMRYDHYGLQMFEVLSLPGHEYSVGTESEMDDAVLEYAKNYIDEIGVDGLQRGFIDDYLDEDKIREYVEDFYENDVRDYPDSYFSDDDFQLTDEQETRKEQLETYIEEMEQLLSDTQEEQQNLEDSDSDEYVNLDEKIKEIESNIETAQDELDSIEVDTEPTEDMIEDKVKEMVDDRMDDPIGVLRDFGYEIKDFVDEDALAQGLVDSDGYGLMNSYDGRYDSINFEGEDYYIMRIN